MPHKSGTVDERNENCLNLRNVFNVSTILVGTQMQKIYLMCDRMPYGVNDITDTRNYAVMNNLYYLPVPNFPDMLYIIRSLYFMPTPEESQHLDYANPNSSLFLFRRFVSNILYCRRLQIVAFSFFFLENTFTLQRIISADISRRTAKK
jgi:hypothetical protein